MIEVIDRTEEGFTAVIRPKPVTGWPHLLIVLEEVVRERERQNSLLAQGRIPFNCAVVAIHPRDKFLVLMEEVGEVAEALQRPGQHSARVRQHLRSELIQLAAVATAWAESLTEVTQ